MKIKHLTGAVLILAVALFFSCENNAPSPAGLPPNCDTTNITYTNSIQAFLLINCGTMDFNCHNATIASTHRGNFSNYYALSQYATGGMNSIFWRYVFTLNKMPLYPYHQLDACSSAQFKQWLLHGAPQ